MYQLPATFFDRNRDQHSVKSLFLQVLFTVLFSEFKTYYCVESGPTAFWNFNLFSSYRASCSPSYMLSALMQWSCNSDRCVAPFLSDPV